MTIQLVREDNEDFAIQYYTVKGIRFRLSVPYKRAPNNELFCFHASVRVWATQESLSPVVNYWMSLKEYFEEMNIIIELLNNFVIIDFESYKKALFVLIESHIKSYKRVIDNDLESYVNRVLTVYTQIEMINDNLNQKEAKITMEKLEKSVYDCFADYIYLTNRNQFSFNPIERNSLSKYKQI